ncbi:phosphate ABC transporter permease PstA [Bremerella cremea]|uniref:phosphate ABC transporter permease PstA n=1 Tax=Bremerella cremea TaxID=1031537 RepID=UPI0031EA89D5
MNNHRWKESIPTAAMWSIAILITALLAWILCDIAWRGFSHVSWDFLTSEPRDAGRQGGIAPMIVSTLLILCVSLSIAFPLSLGTAIWLVEQTRQTSLGGRAIRMSLDALAAVPSIVFGLFGNAFFCVLLGMEYSILSGGLTLACMLLPILTRVTEEALRSVPTEFQHASAAAGLTKTTTLLYITLPTAGPTIAAGAVLGIGRALAETAALIFTAGYVTRMPGSVWDSGRSLSVHIYDMAMNVPGGNSQAYATALVLIVMLLIVNMTVVSLIRLGSNRISGRNAR